MFSCKVCAEKDRRISDLNKQIEFLKRLSQPGIALPILEREIDYAMDGAGREELPAIPSEPELTPEEQEKRDRIDRERDAILSGNY